MTAFRILVAFLTGIVYASAGWSLTLPCEVCAWRVFPAIVLIGISILAVGLIALTALDTDNGPRGT